MAAKKKTSKKSAEKSKKSTAKSKKKAAKETESGVDHYDHFLECMANVDDAHTAAERKKWVKKARACYKKLQTHADDVSAAKMKRAKRAYKSLDDD